MLGLRALSGASSGCSNPQPAVPSSWRQTRIRRDLVAGSHSAGLPGQERRVDRFAADTVSRRLQEAVVAQRRLAGGDVLDPLHAHVARDHAEVDRGEGRAVPDPVAVEVAGAQRLEQARHLSGQPPLLFRHAVRVVDHEEDVESDRSAAADRRRREPRLRPEAWTRPRLGALGYSRPRGRRARPWSHACALVSCPKMGDLVRRRQPLRFSTCAAGSGRMVSNLSAGSGRILGGSTFP